MERPPARWVLAWFFSNDSLESREDKTDAHAGTIRSASSSRTPAASPETHAIDCGEHIIAAIKYHPEQVKIKDVFLTEHVDNRYINDLLQLPDYNKISGFHRAVLTALVGYIRIRVFPSSKMAINQSALDALYLEYLHSTFLQGQLIHSMPRVAMSWMSVFAKGDYTHIDMIRQAVALALDLISSGDADQLREHLDRSASLVPGFAMLQLPNLEGWSLLHFAASINSLAAAPFESIANVLLKCNVPINGADYNGATPLHVAARYCSLGAISALTSRQNCSKGSCDQRGHTPLQTFLLRLSTIPAGVHINYQVLSAAIRSLLPNGEASHLFASCSHHTFISGLALVLTHPDRELGHTVLNLMSKEVTATNAQQAYPVLLSTLTHCIRKMCNSFYPALLELLNCCQGIYLPRFPTRMAWEILNVMVTVGMLHHNSTAVYWAVDHLTKPLEFKAANAQSGDLGVVQMLPVCPVPLKLGAVVAVIRNEDRVLSMLLKKLPVQLVFPLISHREDILRTGGVGPTETPVIACQSSTEPFTLQAFLRQEMAFLLNVSLLEHWDRLSLFNLACLHGHQQCVSTLLKHLYINSGHMSDELTNGIYAQGILIAALHGHVSTLHAIRESVGVQRFAKYLYQPLEGLPWNVLEAFLLQARSALDGSIPNGDQPFPLCSEEGTCRSDIYIDLYQPKLPPAAYKPVLELLLQHLDQHDTSHSKTGPDTESQNRLEPVQAGLTCKATVLKNLLKAKLKTALLPETERIPTQTLMSFLANESERALSMVHASRQLNSTWQELAADMLHSPVQFRTGLRYPHVLARWCEHRLTRYVSRVLARAASKFVPSAQWLKAGYLLITLLDMAKGKIGAGFLPEVTTVPWSDVERAVQDLLRDRNAYTTTIRALLGLRPTGVDGSHTGWSREKWSCVCRLQADNRIKAVFKPPAAASGSGDSTGIMFNKEQFRNNMYVGNVAIESVLRTLTRLVDVIVEEGKAWFGGPDGGDDLLLTAQPPPTKAFELDGHMEVVLRTSRWFAHMRGCLSSVDFLLALQAMNELETMQHYDYFLHAVAPDGAPRDLLYTFFNKTQRRCGEYAMLQGLRDALAHYFFVMRFAGIADNAENNVLIANRSAPLISAMAGDSANPPIKIVDDLVCQLVDSNHQLYTHIGRTNVFRYRALVQESMLPYLLPLLSWRCLRAARKILEMFKVLSGSSVLSMTLPVPALERQPARSHDQLFAERFAEPHEDYFVNFNFMSRLAFLLVKSDRWPQHIIGSYQRHVASEFYHPHANVDPSVTALVGGAAWRTDQLFLLTPVHVALAHGHGDFLVAFMSAFPFFAVHFLDLVAFAGDLQLFTPVLEYLVAVENVGDTLFIPSLLPPSGSAQLAAMRLRGLSRPAQTLQVAMEVVLRSYFHSRQSQQRGGDGNMARCITQHLAPYVHSILKSSTSLSQINLSRDMRIQMMDGSHVFVHSVLSNVTNFLRAMPAVSRNEHYHILHCFSHALERQDITLCDGDRLSDEQQRLVDAIACLSRVARGLAAGGSQTYSLAQRSLMVDERGRTPMDVFLQRGFYAQALDWLTALLPEVSIQPVGGDEAAEVNNYYNAYEYLVGKYSTRPRQHGALPFLFDMDGIVLFRHKQYLDSQQASAHHHVNLWERIQAHNSAHCIVSGAPRFLPLDSILRSVDAHRKDRLPALDLANSMAHLHVTLQYSQYIYDILAPPLSGMKASDNLSLFLHFAMSESYGKLDVFLRARQALSLLNIPVSVLCQPRGTSMAAGAEKRDEGNKGPLQLGDLAENWTTRAADAVRMCHSMSLSSFLQLKQVVTGFFRLRCSLSRQAKIKTKTEWSGSVGRGSVSATSAVEDALLAWHNLPLTCVALGSSGLSLDQFLQRLTQPTASGSPSNRGDQSVLGAHSKKLTRAQSQYSADQYNVWDRMENFDLLRVMQVELSSSAHIAGSSLGALLTPQQSNPTDAHGLAAALDTAYLILDLARYLCLARTLLLVTQDLDETQDLGTRQATTPPRSQSQSQSRSHLHHHHGHERKQHRLYRDHDRLARAMADHCLLRAFIDGKAAAGGDAVSPSTGLNQRIVLLDHVSGEQLRLFLRINQHYSGRLNKLRRVLAQGLAALLLDLGHVSLSELVCRLALQHRTSAHPSNIEPGGVNAATSGRSQAHPGAKVADASESFDHLVQVLKRLRLSDFVQSSLATGPGALPSRFQRFRKFFESLSAALELPTERAVQGDDQTQERERKDWQAVVVALREGRAMAPTAAEMNNLLTLFDSLQADGPHGEHMQMHNKERLLAEAERALTGALGTGSALFWFLQAALGLLQRGDRSLQAESDVSHLLRLNKTLSAQGETHPLLLLAVAKEGRTAQAAARARDACVESFLRLGCSAAAPLGGSLSAIELAAMRGDFVLLRRLLVAYAPPHPALVLSTITGGKRLVFHVLLAMPSSDDATMGPAELTRVRRAHEACVELLLQHGFPVLSPCGGALTCLDLVVLRRVWGLLTAVFQRCHADTHHCALNTEELADMKFALHTVAMVGLACALPADRELQHQQGREVLTMLFKQVAGRQLGAGPVLFDRLLMRAGALGDALGGYVQQRTEVLRLAAVARGMPSTERAPTTEALRGQLLSDLRTLLAGRAGLPGGLAEGLWRRCPFHAGIANLGGFQERPLESPSAAVGVTFADLAARCGDLVLLEVIFEKVFPAALLAQAADWAAEEPAARAVPSQVLSLASLVRICALHGQPDALHGARDRVRAALGENVGVGGRWAALWVRVLALSVLGAQQGEPSLLELIVQCPGAHEVARAILDQLREARTLSGPVVITDPAWALFEMGLASPPRITEKHMVQLLDHILDGVEDPGQDVVEQLRVLTVERSERALHVFCRRGWAELVGLWVERVDHDVISPDSTGLAPWRVSVALGHASVTQVLRPHLPSEVRAAVRELTFFFRQVLIAGYLQERGNRTKARSRRRKHSHH